MTKIYVPAGLDIQLILYFHYSIEYWFRCMDIDGDGRISMYEMEYFYEEQMRRLKFLGITPISFVNCLCQVMLRIVLSSGVNHCINNQNQYI